MIECGIESVITVKSGGFSSITFCIMKLSLEETQKIYWEILSFHLFILSCFPYTEFRNGWLIKTPTKSFAVYAATATEKSEWMAHINKCVSDLLRKSEFPFLRFLFCYLFSFSSFLLLDCYDSYSSYVCYKVVVFYNWVPKSLVL